MAKPDIVLAGGGIGGLTAALALQRAGLRVLVLEQAAQAREIGAGVTLAPNSTRALASLGILDAVRAHADAPSRHVVRHFETGVQTDEFIAGPELEKRFGAPFLQIQRSDLHAVLLSAVREYDVESIRLGQRVLGVAESQEEVEVTLEGGPGMRAPAVVGADGIHSQVRASLFGEDTATFMGYVAWRAVVPLDSIAASGISSGSELYVAPGRSLLRYTVRGGKLLNCVAFAMKKDWAQEGWSVRADPGELIAEFRGWTDTATAIIAAMAAGSCFKWGLFGRAALPGWTRSRVALLGDAAHPMLPFLGQGASMAIEDGVVLGRCARESSSVREAFRRYERTRIQRVTETAARANAQGLRMHGSTAVAQDQFTQPEEAFAAFGYDAATTILAT